jgi:hypothetical protein
MISIGIRELRRHAPRYVGWPRRAGVSPSPSGVRAKYQPPVGSVLDLLPPPPLPHGRRPLGEVVHEHREQERA